MHCGKVVSGRGAGSHNAGIQVAGVMRNPISVVNAETAVAGVGHNLDDCCSATFRDTSDLAHGFAGVT